MAMTIGSLFSGIGGLELGLERAGVGRTVWQVESDSYCRAVLARHWPNAVRYTDVRTARDLPAVDVICGGFPCQDVSGAGKRVGLEGARSGLWYEFARIVAESNPRFVVVENVASGKGRWLPQVRAQLCELGYGTRAIALSAADVGAPHLRRRVFVVGEHRWSLGNGGTDVADRDSHGRGREPAPRLHAGGQHRDDASRCHRFPPRRGDTEGWRSWTASNGPEPGIRRGADGVSARLDGDPRPSNLASHAERLTALGNAVVPQCAEVVGRLLLEMAR